MLSSSRTKVALLSLMAIFQTVTCKCQHSFMTECDSFADLLKAEEVEDWSELIIGSKNESPDESVDLMRFPFDKLPELTTLVVVNKIADLKVSNGVRCISSLKYFNLISFYGNDFRNIENYQFPAVRVKKFSLVNNQIESIESEDFARSQAEIFDLSDNLLDSIPKLSLPETAKIIKIKNNKLTHVDPGSFPSSLTSINLDRNNLRQFQKGVIEDLTNLEELTLSHNKFSELPNIASLKKLITLDLSYNNIVRIEGKMFESLTNLRYLELSNNKIQNYDVLGVVLNPKLAVSLAWNRISFLDFTDVYLEDQEFILFGNPWDCNGWEQYRNQLSSYQNSCDKKLFASGKTPYCVDLSWNEVPDPVGSYLNVLHFVDTMKKNKKSFVCNPKLRSPNKWIHQFEFQCEA